MKRNTDFKFITIASFSVQEIQKDTSMLCHNLLSQMLTNAKPFKIDFNSSDIIISPCNRQYFRT